MIKPSLRLFDLVMIVVSMVIGIGIFRNPAIIAASAGSETIFYSAWIVGAIVSICGALTFSEIGSRLPVAGGYFTMFTVCYSPRVAFMLIWTYILLNAGATAAVAFTGAQYITPVILPGMAPGMGEKLVFWGIMLLLFGINFLGIRLGAAAQNMLSVIKIMLMLIFISAVFFLPESVTTPSLAASPVPAGNILSMLGVSLIAVFFSYGGYQNTSNLGGDVENPQKNIPRGIIIAISMVMVLYLLINYVYVTALGFENLKTSPLVAADLATILFGKAGATFASVAIFISVLGFINTSLLFNPRVLYAMAEDGILPGIFKKVHEKKQVQEFALVFFTGLVILMFVLLQSYNNLLNYVMFNDTISLALAAMCIFILRKKKVGDDTPGYRVQWFPIIPAIFILMQLSVTANVVYSDPMNSLIGCAVMLCGYPMYSMLKKVSSRERGG